MDRRLRHLFIAFMMKMVFAACVVEQPVEEVSLDPTVDVEVVLVRATECMRSSWCRLLTIKIGTSHRE